MRDMKEVAFRILLGLGAVLGVGWLGLQIPPTPFAPYPGQTVIEETVPIPDDLQAPVQRYARAAFGDRVPVITSAVVTGRGHLRFAGITFPARFRFTYLAGQAYHHYIETTWFGIPLLRVNEWDVGGHARLELPVGTVADEAKVDEAANLGLWGESVWLPSTLFTDGRVHCEGVDATTARLVVPFGQGEDELAFTFDERSGHLQTIEALRYRSATDAAKTPWRIDARGWHVFHGVGIPTPMAVTWQDEGTPWLVMDIEDIAYNVDVARDFPVAH